jgi:hypothetical protein
MPADRDTQFQEIRHTLDLIQDRLVNAEDEVLRLSKRVSKLEVKNGRFPFLMPVRQRTKIALVASSVLAVLTCAIAVSPKDIHVGDWRYESEGVPVEAATTLATLAGVIITLREHFKDKRDLAQRQSDDE